MLSEKAGNTFNSILRKDKNWMTSLSDDVEVFVKTNYSDMRFELKQMKKILPKYKLLTSSF